MSIKRNQPKTSVDAGFSLLELIITMAIMLVVMVGASTLLATSLRTRTRENLRSDALAAAQRALNIMSREIGNSGYGRISTMTRALTELTKMSVSSFNRQTT